MVADLIYRHKINVAGKREIERGRPSKICKNCANWHGQEKFTDWRTEHNFLTGRCDVAESSFDVSDMKINQVAVHCGHDGGIYFGENFGCIHWTKKNSGTVPKGG